MSAPNNEASAAFVGLAMIGVVMLFMAAVMFAVASFLALKLTILAFIAWDRPLRIGRLSIEPDEARAFVIRGLIGAAAVPVFLMFVSIVFGFPIEWRLWPYFLLLGYVGGSIGVELLMAHQARQDNAAEHFSTVERFPPPPPKTAPPRPEPPPFHYADWDDEEAQR